MLRLSAGLAAASAAGAPPGKKIRLAVIGGRFGASFSWHEHPNCEVAAVSDLHPERRDQLRKAYRCDNVYNSYEDLLAKRRDLDAVAIFTDAPLHARHVEMAFNHDLHVCCAVPACHTLDDAYRIKELKEKSGLHYMMAESSYYRGGCIYARGAYREGRFGEIFYSEVEYFHDHSVDERLENPKSLYWQPDGSPSWRQGWQPMHYPTHSLAYLVGVTGERITKVSCLGWADQKLLAKLHKQKKEKTFSNEVALMETDRGHMARHIEFRQVPANGIWVRAQRYGDEGSFYMAKRGIHPDLWNPREGRPDEVRLPEYWKSPDLAVSDGGHGGSAGFIVSEFISALVEDREPEVGLRDSLAMTVPGIVAHHSALKGGEQLDVPNLG